MFDEMFEQPSLAAEVFSGKICRGGSVLVAFWLGEGCGRGCVAVNGDAFDEGTTLDDGGTCGQVEVFVRTFSHVRELGFIITGRLGYGV